MERAALEENDHLDWCERRLSELGGRPSVLNPFWYGGSLAIGAFAGWVGDRWSLVPEQDRRSRAILEQMREDEIHHAETARAAGAAPLPAPVRALMRLTSRISVASRSVSEIPNR